MFACTECAKVNPTDLKFCTTSMLNSAHTILPVQCVVFLETDYNVWNLNMCDIVICTEYIGPSECFMKLLLCL
jgi:hypothetical protein